VQVAATGSLGAAPRSFHSNIAFRRNLPFLGRDALIDRMLEVLGDPFTENVVVLRGQPGAGKSELAREFARRHHNRYPGGTFFIDGRAGRIALDLAQIGQNCLGLQFPNGLRLEDQGARTLHVLAEVPSLLIFDGVVSEEAIRAWLPSSGVRCHAVITSVVDCWDVGWQVVPVGPLPPDAAFDLITQLAGSEAAARYGQELAMLAGGLPVQIVPMAAFMYREARRGRIDAIKLTLTKEAGESFRGVYEQLEPPARLLLHAAARMNLQHIISADIAAQLAEACGWSDAEFQAKLDACRDLGWLEGGAELRMHQLYGKFLLGMKPSHDIATELAQVVRAQARRMIDVAAEVVNAPNLIDRAAALMTYPVDVQFWNDADISVAAGETIGSALLEIGQFAAARPWYERAVAAKQKGDVHGRVDHASLGSSLHQVGLCLSSTGEFAAARPWYERAVAAKQKGDVHGRVDHKSLAVTIRAIQDLK
jgi:tetratricopeptide (TPR) repeat protein